MNYIRTLFIILLILPIAIIADTPKNEKKFKTSHYFYPDFSKSSGASLSYSNYIFYKKNKKQSYYSLLKSSARYTTKNHNALSFFSSQYINKNLQLLAKVGGSRQFSSVYDHPTNDRVYSTTYQHYTSSVQTALLKQVKPAWWAGPYIGVSTKVIEDVALNTTLKNQNRVGNTGGTQVGIGINVSHNKRNTEITASNGYLTRLFLRYYNDSLAGDYSYIFGHIDHRRYIPVAANAVIALQANIKGVWDYNQATGVPFYVRPSLGGRSSIRGLPTNYIQDKVTAFARAEYREYGIIKKLGLNLFTEVGLATKHLNANPTVIPGIGVGLKYQTGKTESMHYNLEWGLTTKGWIVSLNYSDAY